GEAGEAVGEAGASERGGDEPPPARRAPAPGPASIGPGRAIEDAEDEPGIVGPNPCAASGGIDRPHGRPFGEAVRAGRQRRRPAPALVAVADDAEATVEWDCRPGKHD